MDVLKDRLKSTGYPVDTVEEHKFTYAIKEVLKSIKAARSGEYQNQTLDDITDLEGATGKKMETLEERMLSSLQTGDPMTHVRLVSPVVSSILESQLELGNPTTTTSEVVRRNPLVFLKLKETRTSGSGESGLKEAMQTKTGEEVEVRHPNKKSSNVRLQLPGDELHGDGLLSNSKSNEISGILRRNSQQRRLSSVPNALAPSQSTVTTVSINTNSSDKVRTRIRKRPKTGNEVTQKGEQGIGMDELQNITIERQRVKYMASHSHFTETEVKALQNMFRAYNGQSEKNVMDRHMFRYFFRTTFGVTDDVMLDQIFRFFDSNHEGSFGDSSWIRNLSIILRGTMEEHIKFCFGVYDLNGDGGIGKEELMNIMRGCLLNNPRADDEELSGSVGEIVDLLLTKVSSSKHGQISLHNFRHAVRTDPNYLEALGRCMPDIDKVTSFIALISDNYNDFTTSLSLENDPAHVYRRPPMDSLSQVVVNLIHKSGQNVEL